MIPLMGSPHLSKWVRTRCTHTRAHIHTYGIGVFAWGDLRAEQARGAVRVVSSQTNTKEYALPRRVVSVALTWKSWHPSSTFFNLAGNLKNDVRILKKKKKKSAAAAKTKLLCLLNPKAWSSRSMLCTLGIRFRSAGPACSE